MPSPGPTKLRKAPPRTLQISFLLALVLAQPARGQDPAGRSLDRAEAAARTIDLHHRLTELVDEVARNDEYDTTKLRDRVGKMLEDLQADGEDYASAAAHQLSVARQVAQDGDADEAHRLLMLAASTAEAGCERFAQCQACHLVRCQIDAERVSGEGVFVPYQRLLLFATRIPWAEWSEELSAYVLDDLGEMLKQFKDRRQEALDLLTRCAGAPAPDGSQPRNPYILLIHADAAFWYGRLEESRDLLLELTGSDQGLARMRPLYVFQLLNAVAVEMQNEAYALELFEEVASGQAARGAQTEALLDLFRARLLADLGQVAEAIPLVRDIRQGAASPPVLFNVAEVWEALARQVEGNAGLAASLEAKTGFRPVHLYRRARDLCARILRDEDAHRWSTKDRLKVETVLGRTTVLAGDLANGIQILENALQRHELEISEPPLDLLLALGDAYTLDPDQTQGPKKARLFLERYVFLLDQASIFRSPEIRIRLARLYFDLGSYRDAEESARLALEGLTQNSRGSRQLNLDEFSGLHGRRTPEQSRELIRELELLRARCFWAQGDRRHACDALAAWVARHPLDDGIRLRLAEWQFEAGDSARALESLRDFAPLRNLEALHERIEAAVAAKDDGDNRNHQSELERLGTELDEVCRALVVSARIDHGQGLDESRWSAALENAIGLEHAYRAVERHLGAFCKKHRLDYRTPASDFEEHLFTAKYQLAVMRSRSPDAATRQRARDDLIELLDQTARPEVQLALGDHFRADADRLTGSTSMAAALTAQRHYEAAIAAESVRSDPVRLSDATARFEAAQGIARERQAEAERRRLIWIVAVSMLLVMVVLYLTLREIYRGVVWRRVTEFEGALRTFLDDRVKIDWGGDWRHFAARPALREGGRFNYGELEKKRASRQKDSVADVATLGELVAAIDLGWRDLQISPDCVDPRDKESTIALLSYVNQSRRSMAHDTDEIEGLSKRGMNRRVNEYLAVLRRSIEMQPHLAFRNWLNALSEASSDRDSTLANLQHGIGYLAAFERDRYGTTEAETDRARVDQERHRNLVAQCEAARPAGAAVGLVQVLRVFGRLPPTDRNRLERRFRGNPKVGLAELRETLTSRSEDQALANLDAVLHTAPAATS